jgi:hypothetical protein
MRILHVLDHSLPLHSGCSPVQSAHQRVRCAGGLSFLPCD